MDTNDNLNNINFSSDVIDDPQNPKRQGPEVLPNTAPKPATHKRVDPILAINSMGKGDNEEFDTNDFEDRVISQTAIAKDLGFTAAKKLYLSLRTQESNGNDNAVSPQAARGRYQITDDLAKRYKLDNTNLLHNITMGVDYLDEGYEKAKKYAQDPLSRVAIAATYFHGGDGALRNIKDGALSETRDLGGKGISSGEYASQVMARWGEKMRSEGDEQAPGQQQQDPSQVPAKIDDKYTGYDPNAYVMKDTPEATPYAPPDSLQIPNPLNSTERALYTPPPVSTNDHRMLETYTDIWAKAPTRQYPNTDELQAIYRTTIPEPKREYFDQALDIYQRLSGGPAFNPAFNDPAAWNQSNSKILPDGSIAVKLEVPAFFSHLMSTIELGGIEAGEQLFRDEAKRRVDSINSYISDEAKKLDDLKSAVVLNKQSAFDKLLTTGLNPLALAIPGVVGGIRDILGVIDSNSKLANAVRLAGEKIDASRRELVAGGIGIAGAALDGLGLGSSTDSSVAGYLNDLASSMHRQTQVRTAEADRLFEQSGAGKVDWYMPVYGGNNTYLTTVKINPFKLGVAAAEQIAQLPEMVAAGMGGPAGLYGYTLYSGLIRGEGIGDAGAHAIMAGALATAIPALHSVPWYMRPIASSQLFGAPGAIADWRSRHDAWASLPEAQRKSVPEPGFDINTYVQDSIVGAAMMITDLLPQGSYDYMKSLNEFHLGPEPFGSPKRPTLLGLPAQGYSFAHDLFLGHTNPKQLLLPPASPESLATTLSGVEAVERLSNLTDDHLMEISQQLVSGEITPNSLTATLNLFQTSLARYSAAIKSWSKNAVIKQLGEDAKVKQGIAAVGKIFNDAKANVAAMHELVASLGSQTIQPLDDVTALRDLAQTTLLQMRRGLESIKVNVDSLSPESKETFSRLRPSAGDASPESALMSIGAVENAKLLNAPETGLAGEAANPRLVNVIERQTGATNEDGSPELWHIGYYLMPDGTTKSTTITPEAYEIQKAMLIRAGQVIKAAREGKASQAEVDKVMQEMNPDPAWVDAQGADSDVRMWEKEQARLDQMSPGEKEADRMDLANYQVRPDEPEMITRLRRISKQAMDPSNFNSMPFGGMLATGVVGAYDAYRKVMDLGQGAREWYQDMRDRIKSGEIDPRIENFLPDMWDKIDMIHNTKVSQGFTLSREFKNPKDAADFAELSGHLTEADNAVGELSAAYNAASDKMNDILASEGNGDAYEAAYNKYMEAKNEYYAALDTFNGLRAERTYMLTHNEYYPAELKIVPHGGPMPVGHGTQADFEHFSSNAYGTATDLGWYGIGAYFASLKPKPTWSGEEGKPHANSPSNYAGTDTGANVRKVYLDIRNPLIWDYGKDSSIQRLLKGIDIYAKDQGDKAKGDIYLDDSQYKLPRAIHDDVVSMLRDYFKDRGDLRKNFTPEEFEAVKAQLIAKGKQAQALRDAYVANDKIKNQHGIDIDDLGQEFNRKYGQGTTGSKVFNLQEEAFETELNDSDESIIPKFKASVLANLDAEGKLLKKRIENAIDNYNAASKKEIELQVQKAKVEAEMNQLSYSLNGYTTNGVTPLTRKMTNDERLQVSRSISTIIKSKGYDGVFVVRNSEGPNPSIDEYVAFHPDQIHNYFTAFTPKDKFGRLFGPSNPTLSKATPVPVAPPDSLAPNGPKWEIDDHNPLGLPDPPISVAPFPPSSPGDILPPVFGLGFPRPNLSFEISNLSRALKSAKANVANFFSSNLHHLVASSEEAAQAVRSAVNATDKVHLELLRFARAADQLLKVNGASVRDWYDYMTQDRLEGRRAYYAKQADIVSQLSDSDLVLAFTNKSPLDWYRVIKQMNRRRDDLFPTASSVLTEMQKAGVSGDFTGVRTTIQNIFSTGAEHVVNAWDPAKHNGETYEQFAQRPEVKAVNAIYSEGLGEMLRRAFVATDATPSADLGPSGLYFPLISKEQAERLQKPRFASPVELTRDAQGKATGVRLSLPFRAPDHSGTGLEISTDRVGLVDTAPPNQAPKGKGNISVGKSAPAEKPSSPANYFASGLSPSGYTPTLDAIARTMIQQVRRGDAAGMIDTLIHHGIFTPYVATVDPETGDKSYPDFNETTQMLVDAGPRRVYPVKRQIGTYQVNQKAFGKTEVTREYPAYATDTYSPAQSKMIVDKAIWGEIAPILEAGRKATDQDVERLAGKLTHWSLIGLMEPTYHTWNVAKAVNGVIPYMPVQAFSPDSVFGQSMNTLLTLAVNYPNPLTLAAKSLGNAIPIPGVRGTLMLAGELLDPKFWYTSIKTLQTKLYADHTKFQRALGEVSERYARGEATDAELHRATVQLASRENLIARAQDNAKWLAERGAVPERTGKTTFSPNIANLTDAELVGPAQFAAFRAISNLSRGIRGKERMEAPVDMTEQEKGLGKKLSKLIDLSPLIYGYNGIDMRARLAAADAIRTFAPNMSAKDVWDTMSAFGIYNRFLESKLGGALKTLQVAPFYSAASAGAKRGVIEASPFHPYGLAGKVMENLAPGAGGIPNFAAKMSSIISEYSMMALVAWGIAHKQYRDKWPWEEADARIMEIKLRDEDVNQNYVTKSLFPDPKKGGYVAFRMSEETRGLNLLGWKPFYDTMSAFKWTPGRNGEHITAATLMGAGSSASNLMNIGTSGPLLRVVPIAAMGISPHWVPSLDAQSGKFSPYFFSPMGKTDYSLSRLPKQALLGAFALNSFGENLAESFDMLPDKGGIHAPALSNLIKTAAFLFTNNAFKQHDPVTSAQFMQKAIDKARIISAKPDKESRVTKDSKDKVKVGGTSGTGKLDFNW